MRGWAASACSVSHCAQQIVRRTHSGDGDADGGTEALALGSLAVVVVVSSSKAILSQRTKAASCCTRTRGLVPTCDSSTRDAVRARWARGVEPFLSKSRVLSAGGRGSGLKHYAGSWLVDRMGRTQASPPGKRECLHLFRAIRRLHNVAAAAPAPNPPFCKSVLGEHDGRA